MSDKINVGKKVSSVSSAPEFDSYSGVIINIDEENYVSAGDITGNAGRVLEITNPFGSTAMAEDILARLKGFQYQPYEAEGAILNPAAELGDGVSVNGIYSGIYSKSTRFGRLMKSDISAPEDEEIDHEYEYVSATDKKIERQYLESKAQLKVLATQISAEITARTDADTTLTASIKAASDAITSEVSRATSAEGTLSSQITQQASEISAKVSATGGSSSSFGWSLTDSGFTLSANGNTVMNVNSSGLEVSGKITATSGTIGGFNIGSNALWNNISSYGGSQSSGVYLGTNGIQCGQGFKVDSYGNLNCSSLSCSNASISGAVTCTSLNVASDTGCSIGGSYFSGSTLASYISGGGLASSALNYNQLVNYINANSGYIGSLAIGTVSDGQGTNAAYWNHLTVVTGGSISKSYQGIVKMTNGSYYSCYNHTLSLNTTTIHYIGHS